MAQVKLPLLILAKLTSTEMALTKETICAKATFLLCRKTVWEKTDKLSKKHGEQGQTTLNDIKFT